jgi:hypothetical protein
LRISSWNPPSAELELYLGRGEELEEGEEMEEAGEEKKE